MALIENSTGDDRVENNSANEKLEAGYAELAKDPEYLEEQRRRKIMRGVIRRGKAIKMRWPDS